MPASSPILEMKRPPTEAALLVDLAKRPFQIGGPAKQNDYSRPTL